MLERTLLELVGGQCFSSPGLAKTLLDYLCCNPKNNGRNNSLHSLYFDCREALLQSMEKDWPRQFRRDDMRRLIDNVFQKSLFVSEQLPLLDKLSKTLMVRNGDYFHYRDTQVQAYARLAVDLDPTLLAAWHFSSWISELPVPNADTVRRVLDHQKPLFAPQPNPVLPYAEGHVHLGGVSAAELILGEQLLSGIKSTEKDKTVILRLRRILINLLTWSSENNHDHIDFQENLRKSCRDDPDLSGKKNRLPDWELLMKLHSQRVVGTPEWLLSEVAQRAKDMGGLSHCWLWLLVFLMCRYRQPNTPVSMRIAILYLLSETMHLRRKLIMDDLGLSRFTQDYFSEALRKKATKEYSLHPNMNHLLASPNDLLEAKGGPSLFKPEKIAKLAKALGDSLGQPFPQPVANVHTGFQAKYPNASELSYIRTLDQWHFCAHFNRSVKDEKDGQRSAPDVAKLWESAEELQTSLQSNANWNLPEFLGGRENPHFCFEPARWLRGLDVAGNENDLRIEWFAPLLRWLRLGSHPNHPYAQVSGGFHLSIHAGEDYAHPLSGMRHVDETVRFCEMRDGDRLGHALALGVKPKHWAEQHGDMILPVDEHLDNLVWAWHHASLLSARLQLAGQVLPLLERRIQRICRYGAWLHHPEINSGPRVKPTETPSDKNSYQKLKCWISAGDDEINPETLFQAWLLRRNCYYQFNRIGSNPSLSAKEQCSVPDLIRLQQLDVNVHGVTSERLYRQRHQQLALGNSSPIIVVVRVQHNDHCHAELNQARETMDENILYDSDSPEELNFMHALQDYLLHEYDRKGLIIEANPTSNVYISRVGKYTDHPIFRWNPPDESTLFPGNEHNRYGLRCGPIHVLVNTDDPGIMPTTLRTEFSLLREAAIERGISRTVAEDWLERLRRYGVEQFHRNHQQVFRLKMEDS